MSASASPEPAIRPLTGGALLGAASKMVVTAAGAVTAIAGARILGPRGWGTYFIAQSLLVILIGASTLGVEHGIAYFVGARRWAARAALDAALSVALLVGTAAAAIGFGVRVFAPSAFAGLSLWLTAVAVAALPFSLCSLYTSYVALAADRYEVATAMPAAQAVLVLASVLPGAIVFGVEGAVVGMTTASIAIGMGAIFWGRRRLSQENTGVADATSLRSAISFGVRGYAANTLQLVNYRLDLFILSAVASTAAVGRYGLAVSITSLLWVLPGALSDVLFPRVARLSGDGDEATREMVETKSVRHASLVVAATSLALGASLELLVVPVFGAVFRPAAHLGLILLPGSAAIAVGSVLAATIVGRGNPNYTLAVAVITTPITVGLYAVLIPPLHATGAALASTMSYGLSFTLMCWVYRRVTGRGVLPLLVPTRAELGDWYALPQALLDRAHTLRRRTS